MRSTRFLLILSGPFGLVLGGCPWIGPELAEQRYDVDEDGVAWPDDCDEGNPDVFPGATEVCNGVDDDCSGAPGDDEADGDGDGVRVCEGDCDDGDAARAPTFAEVCGNGVDEDCVADSEPCRWDAGPGLVPDVAFGGEHELFGLSVAGGDWNGDGVADLAVGSPIEPDPAIANSVDRGAVHLFVGPLDESADWTVSQAVGHLRGGFDAANAGFALANAGGLGDMDLVVAGIPGQMGDVSRVGAIGAATGATQVGEVTLDPVLMGTQRMGYAVVSLDPWEQDGAHALFAIEAGRGIFFSVGGGVLISVGMPACVDQMLGSMTNLAARAGDVDGDGLDDVIVGSAACGTSQDMRGVAYVMDRALVSEGAYLEDIALARIVGDQPSQYVGFGVAGGRDQSGDGLADVAVLAPLAHTFTQDDLVWQGSETWVVNGRSAFAADVTRADVDAVIVGSSVREDYTFAAHLGSDLDGDGLAEVVLGNPMSPNGELYGEGAGRVSVFYGPIAGEHTLDQGAQLVGAGHQGLGWSFAELGDIDADGTDDLAIGAYASSTVGSAVLLLGRGE